jgi:glutaminyl-tRNA synthetase
MRDPTIYRIRRMHHHQTGDKWCIYPMYDYTHCISDALEGITHSICTLEFEDHRPLYDWCIDQLPLDCHPQQIEFARLEINYTVMSKRKLLRLVEEKHVAGWDDPRMPTIAGMRRRGYPAAAIRDFCNRIGVARAKSCVDVGLLEFCVREELFRSAKRALGVVKPIKLVIEDFPADRTDWSEMPFHPEKPELGTRKIPITREMWIESDDYMDSPPKDYFRLAIGREVRLRYGYIVKCERVDRDANGNVTTIFCSHDPSTLGKNPADGRKVKGIIHWVSAKHAQEVEVRLYDRLFQIENPEGDASKDFVDFINPQSLVTCKGFIEPGLENLRPGESVQLERLGYFVADSVDTAAGKIVLNKTVGLRDTYTPPK